MNDSKDDVASRLAGAKLNREKIDLISNALGARGAQLVAPDEEVLRALKSGEFKSLSGLEAISESRKEKKKISGSGQIVETSFTDLLERLGPPDKSPSDGKSAAQWFIRVSGEYFTVYDSRMLADLNSDGTGLAVDEIRSHLKIGWSIGGSEKGAKLSAFVAFLK
jgi:hypothetical protein